MTVERTEEAIGMGLERREWRIRKKIEEDKE